MDRIVVAVARHLVDYWTWRSLALDRRLGSDVAAEAAVAMLRATVGWDEMVLPEPGMPFD